MQFDQNRSDSTECIAVHDKRLGGWMEGKAGRVVHSSQCFLVILHLTGWTNRLSELSSPWERPTASLIHNSLLFPYIPIISYLYCGDAQNQPMLFMCVCVLEEDKKMSQILG